MQTRRESEKTNQTRFKIQNPTLHLHHWNFNGEQFNSGGSVNTSTGSNTSGIRAKDTDATHRPKEARKRIAGATAIQMLRAVNWQGERVAIRQ
jgi:hypothetical protein